MSLNIQAILRRGEFCLEVDTQIPASGVTAVFGRSGCGKTTLLRLIAGLERAQDASITFNDQTWQTGRTFVPLQKRRVGLVFQEASLLPHLSVQGNLLYGYQRTPPEQRRLQLDQISDMLGISDLLDRPANRLSGGQSQRVALGRALLCSPQLLLLDEPLAALDGQTKADILPFLARLASEAGVPMLLVSHNALEVEKLADRILFMENGRISSLETLQQATTRADSPLFHDSGPAVILQGEIGAPDADGRIPFGPEHARFWLPQAPKSLRPGRQRLRIAARDVSLAIGSTGQLSIQNRLTATITEIADYQQQQLISLKLEDGQLLLAEITLYASRSLQLQVGMTVTALVKGVALLE